MLNNSDILWNTKGQISSSCAMDTSPPERFRLVYLLSLALSSDSWALWTSGIVGGTREMLRLLQTDWWAWESLSVFPECGTRPGEVCGWAGEKPWFSLLPSLSYYFGGQIAKDGVVSWATASPLKLFDTICSYVDTMWYFEVPGDCNGLCASLLYYTSHSTGDPFGL